MPKAIAGMMRIDLVVQRIDELRIASDMEGKLGVGMVIKCPDGEGSMRIGLSVEAVRTLYEALVEVGAPPNPVLPKQ